MDDNTPNDNNSFISFDCHLLHWWRHPIEMLALALDHEVVHVAEDRLVENAGRNELIAIGFVEQGAAHIWEHGPDAFGGWGRRFEFIHRLGRKPRS